MSGAADRPPGWLWAKVVGAFLGMVAAIVLFVPFSSFQRYIPPREQGCPSGWTNVVGMEFCGAHPTWIAAVAGLLGLVAGWVVVSLVQRAVTRP